MERYEPGCLRTLIHQRRTVNTLELFRLRAFAGCLLVIQIVGCDEPSLRIGYLQANAVHRRVEVAQIVKVDQLRVAGQYLRSRIRALPADCVEF